VPLSTGQIVNNRYHIGALLGKGGMGAVYRAWDVNLNIPIALKEMTPDPRADTHTLAELRQQFAREAQVLANLRHPNLVRVTDYFSWGGSACMVMNFIEGENLAERIKREGAQSETQVLEWAQQLLDALAYCHAQGVIHRDVKPQNVIITPEGKPVLVDFGLVKLWDPQDPLTQTVIRTMGTPEYAPPEQYGMLAGHTDPRSDLYSLGATLYHALTGQAPLSAADRMARPDQFVLPRILAPYLSLNTERVVLKAMELPIVQRFSTAQEMAGALRGAIPPIPSPVVLPIQTGRKQPQIPVRVWGLVSAAVVVSLVGFVVGTRLLRPNPDHNPANVPGTLPISPIVPISEPPPTSTTPMLTSTPTPVTPTSTPWPTATRSSDRIYVPTPNIAGLAAAYYPVSLDSVSNALLTVDLLSPLAGDVTLGGVPFQLSARVFKSQASPAPDNSYPTRASLQVDVPRTSRLHLLLTTGNGFNRFAGMVIGEVMASCDGTWTPVADLQLGRDVREWHVADNVVSAAPRARQVWSGAITNFPDLTGHVDMLSLDLPAACRNGNLTGIEIIDSSTNTVNSLDPALNLIGVTVEYYP